MPVASRRNKPLLAQKQKWCRMSGRLSLGNVARSLRQHFSLFGMRGVVRRATIGMPGSTAIFSAPLPRTQQSVLIRLGTTDVAAYEHVFIDDEYGFRLHPNASVIIDVGANCGMSAVYFSQQYPDAKIIAIEPEPNNFDVLSKNAKLFTRIAPVHAGLWNRDGFISVPRWTGWGTSVRDPSGPSDILVPSLTLNTLLAQYGIEEIDLLKIDAEGAECEIFEDFSTWIDRVKVVCAELHDRFRPGCSKAFENATANFPIKFRHGTLSCAAREGAILKT
jgi:FkbM family methyltransferase